jgi:copper chaperone CopZ
MAQGEREQSVVRVLRPGKQRAEGPTGDSDLPEIKRYKAIKIITPRDFEVFDSSLERISQKVARPIFSHPCSKDRDWLIYSAMVNTREMILQAEGITCSSCAGDMEVILREKTGILEASVNFADEIIRVRYDLLLLDRKAVFIAVRGLGYKVRILEEK